MNADRARQLLLAAAVVGLVLSVIGALTHSTSLTTPVAVLLVGAAAAADVQARARERRARRESGRGG